MTSIRSMADDYFDLTGESAYMGKSGGVHHFVNGTVRGDNAATYRMQFLLEIARTRTPVGHRWVHPIGSDHVMLVGPDGKALRTVPATEHPWRES